MRVTVWYVLVLSRAHTSVQGAWEPSTELGGGAGGDSFA